MTEIDPGADAMTAPAPDEERRARARKRLEDAGRVTAEARTESREQVRELMGWA